MPELIQNEAYLASDSAILIRVINLIHEFNTCPAIKLLVSAAGLVNHFEKFAVISSSKRRGDNFNRKISSYSIKRRLMRADVTVSLAEGLCGRGSLAESLCRLIAVQHLALQLMELQLIALQL